MPSVLRAFILVVCLVLVAGLGSLSVASADPPEPQVHIAGFPAGALVSPQLHLQPTPPPDELWNLQQIGLPCDPPYDDFNDVPNSHAVVAVIDTGVDLEHPLFVDRLVPGYDFVNNDDDPSDDQGHGTHVAGTVAFIAPSAKIMPVKALSASGAGSHSWIANAVVWAADHGADVINMSLGGPYSSTTMREAMAYAWAHNVVLVAAAGSSSSSNPTYPASYDEVMGIAATTQEDERAPFSNYGPYISVAAPGVGIYGALRGGGYQAWTGTAMSTSHVSALAALVEAYYPSLIAWQIRTAIERGADDLGPPGWDPVYGHGRINVCRTLEVAQSMALHPVVTTVAPVVAPALPTD